MALTEVVVAYDVSSNDHRAMLAARLSRWGVRLQRSVFVCQLPAASMEELVTEWEGLINLESDVLHIFRQCANCGSQRTELGQAPRDLDARYWII